MFGINIKKRNPSSTVKSQELVGIALSDDNVKIAHVRVAPHKREVLNLLSRNISNLPSDQISDIIKDYFNKLKLKNPDVVNVIPSHLVITKNIEIPSTNPEEIKEIISLQAGRHTPYSREEIIIDHIDIGTYKHSYTKVLLLIATQRLIKQQFEILGRAGIRLEKVVLLSEGLAWFIPRVLKLKTDDSPISVVHIDEKSSEFDIVFRNNLAFIRSIPIGAQHLVDENYRLRFIDEIKRSLEAYQSEDIEKVPNTLVLTGAVEKLKDLEAVLNDNLHLPIKMTSCLKNVVISDQALKTASEAKHSSFLNVIVPLLAWEGLKANLIPEEVKLRKSLEQRGRELIKTGIFILTLFVFVFFILISKIYFKSAYLDALSAKYQSLDKEAQELETDFTEVSLVKNYLSNRGYSLEVLSELYDVAPSNLQLSDIKFDIQSKFSIKGTAESMSTVFSFVDNMEKSKSFKDVKTKYTTKRKDGLNDVTDFEITSLIDKKID